MAWSLGYHHMTCINAKRGKPLKRLINSLEPLGERVGQWQTVSPVVIASIQANMASKSADRWRKAQLHATVSPEVKERMKREAEELGMSMSDYINLCTYYFQDLRDDKGEWDEQGKEQGSDAAGHERGRLGKTETA